MTDIQINDLVSHRNKYYLVREIQGGKLLKLEGAEDGALHETNAHRTRVSLILGADSRLEPAEARLQAIRDAEAMRGGKLPSQIAAERDGNGVFEDVVDGLFWAAFATAIVAAVAVTYSVLF